MKRYDPQIGDLVHARRGGFERIGRVISDSGIGNLFVVSFEGPEPKDVAEYNARALIPLVYAPDFKASRAAST